MTNVRKAALITFIASALTLANSLWPLIRVAFPMLNLTGKAESSWTAILSAGVDIVFLATLLVFFFALLSEREPSILTRRLRFLSLGVAITFGMLVVGGILTPIAPDSYWAMLGRLDWRKASSVLTAVEDPRTLSNALSLLYDLGLVLLLIAFYREPRVEANAPVSRLLRVGTTSAMIVCGLSLAFAVVRLALTPHNYAQLQSLFIQANLSPPTLGSTMWRALRGVLNQACLFAAPFVVYKGRIADRGTTAP